MKLCILDGLYVLVGPYTHGVRSWYWRRGMVRVGRRVVSVVYRGVCEGRCVTYRRDGDTNVLGWQVMVMHWTVWGVVYIMTMSLTEG